MAGTGRLAARRKARLLPTGRVAHGLAQRSRAVHPLPPPRLETEQRSSPPPLPPPCAVRPTRRSLLDMGTHGGECRRGGGGTHSCGAISDSAGPGPKTARRRPGTSNYDPRRPGPTLTAPTGGDPHLRCGDPQLPFHREGARSPAVPLFASTAAHRLRPRRRRAAAASPVPWGDTACDLSLIHI